MAWPDTVQSSFWHWLPVFGVILSLSTRKETSHVLVDKRDFFRAPSGGPVGDALTFYFQ